MWNFPTTAEIFNFTRDMAGLFTGKTAARLLLGAPRYQGLTVTGSDYVDAAAWVDKAKSQAMISVVSLSYDDVSVPISIALPDDFIASTLGANLWGNGHWRVGLNGTLVSDDGVGGLTTAVFLVNLA